MEICLLSKDFKVFYVWDATPGAYDHLNASCSGMHQTWQVCLFAVEGILSLVVTDVAVVSCPLLSPIDTFTLTALIESVSVTSCILASISHLSYSTGLTDALWDK